MIAAITAALLIMAAEPATLYLNFPTTDLGANSPCLLTFVRVEPHDRLLVSQHLFVSPRLGRQRPRAAITDLANLPALLAKLKPNRCLAMVDAASNAPLNATIPVYEELRKAGYRDFVSADSSVLGTDPR
jgi:hypothetical protein